MKKIEDQICQAACKELLFFLDTIQSSNFDNYEIPDDLISAMAELNYTQQQMLVCKANTYFAFTLNTMELSRQIEKVEELREEKEREDLFLLKGAPLALMNRLFAMHATEFSRRRNILGLKGVRSGRPVALDEAVEHEVWRLWQVHLHLDEKERFITVATKSDLDLHFIWHSLREHIES